MGIIAGVMNAAFTALEVSTGPALELETHMSTIFYTLPSAKRKGNRSFRWMDG